jgi:uncharacterized Zn finger protein
LRPTTINEHIVRRLAGRNTYLKGSEYYCDGHVESFEAGPDRIRAIVQGNARYTVTLTSDEGGTLAHTCDCPQGAEGSFCKHCVATALVWIHRGPAPAQPASSRKSRPPTLEDAEKLLRDEDADSLIRMVIDWAKNDERLHERLVQYAARRSGPEAGIAAAKRAFEKAVYVRDYVDYREASGWAHDVDNAIDSFEALLNSGMPAGVIELCESALVRLDAAIQQVDDSDGHFGGLRDRLEGIHLRTCEVARPDPAALARRLFKLELSGDFDIFDNAAERYAGVLGPEDLKEYRKIAEAEWRKVPARTASQDREFGKHFRITRMMESLAKASGDTDELVAVMSRDLSSAYGYLKIAEVYRDAGRHDEALDWAEKGLAGFPVRPDSRLREFVAEEYHRRRRHEDAMRLIWTDFTDRPYLATYEKLREHARKAKAWPEWRERAVDELRRRIERTKGEATGQRSKSRWLAPDADHSILVEIFMEERDVEAAWSEALKGGCSGHLWLRLAKAREEAHPADAAPIYLRQGEAAVHTERKGRYEEAVELLAKAA